MHMNNNEKDFETIEEVKDKKRVPAEKRDIAQSKKNLKKVVLIIVSVFGILLLLLGALKLVDWLLHRPSGEDELNPWLFFEADYDKNIYEDEAYMVLNRDVHFDYMGFDRVITDENIDDYPEKGMEAGKMFIDYFKCIADGDYESYPSFFTEELLKDENFDIPEKFTMQGVYDIRISIKHPPQTVDGIRLELYEVSYRIFENNGTFRDDIYPDETRTLVFGVEVSNGEAKISAISYRAEG